MTQELELGAPVVLGDRYLVGELVGRGGMASVYRAHDQMLGRTVAIKIFAEDGDGRRHSEVRVLAALNHPALVTVFDAHLDAEPSPYLVMEFVDGPPLNRRLEAGRIAPADVLAMTKDLSEALTVVHAAGIVHRDVKPSNVLLTGASGARAFRAKLADFGIAQLAEATRLTMPGSFMGTAAYLAPEQLNGADPAPSADIYSLGLVVLESFSGERAFPGTTAESMASRVVGDPGMPQSVPVAMRELLAAMTARNPNDRPSAAQVFELTAQAERELPEEVDDFETAPMLSDDAPTKVYASASETVRMGPVPPGAAPSRKRRWIAIAVAAALVVAGVVGVTSQFAASPPAASPQLPVVDAPLSTHLEQLLATVTPELQPAVVEVANTAAAGDPATALTQLDTLTQSVLQATADGTVSSDQSARISAAIELVRRDLEALVPVEEPAGPANDKPDKPEKPGKKDK